MTRNQAGTAMRGVLAALLVVTMTGCEGSRRMQTITEAEFGVYEDRPVKLYTLDNGSGMIAKITNYGGIVTELHVPDGAGGTVDVALGFDTLDDYIERNPYFGAMVGRVGNRIAFGRFELDGRTHQLATNNDPHHLHGGVRGFDRVLWDATRLVTEDGPGLRLVYRSADGEEGYPGTLLVTVDYVLTFDDELRVDVTATTDAPTPVNVVHHTYWNLAGHASGTILDHELTLDAARYTPADATLIPTGEIAPVAGTPFDFTEAKTIGRDIGRLPPEGDDPGGYDLNYVLDPLEDDDDDDLRRAARLHDPARGLVMEVWTDMPGVQLYSGNFLDDLAGKGGAVYAKHAGLCLETQCFPNAVNELHRPGWPDPVLRPGETYRHTMVHRFDRGD
jgi:aldose 1-epimerase